MHYRKAKAPFRRETFRKEKEKNLIFLFFFLRLHGKLFGKVSPAGQTNLLQIICLFLFWQSWKVCVQVFTRYRSFVKLFWRGGGQTVHRPSTNLGLGWIGGHSPSCRADHISYILLQKVVQVTRGPLSRTRLQSITKAGEPRLAALRS